MIPSFRNDAEAAQFADINEPLRHALSAQNSHDYARQYGRPAADAAERCRKAALAGDQRSMRVHMMAMSLLNNPPVRRVA